MNGQIAQLIALTCYGNAVLRGKETPKFFPGNSTCQFCEFVKFVEFAKGADGSSREITVSGSPDEWFLELPRRNVAGLRLISQPRNDSKISDRKSAGFVGGGSVWIIEAALKDGTSEYWINKWEVKNRNAPDRRIWDVRYGLIEKAKTKPWHGRPLHEIQAGFQQALKEIFSFAQKNVESFAPSFEKALKAFDEPGMKAAYHEDIFPQNTLAKEAQSILIAATHAWVFGGMGSWNDVGFEGETQKEYERVSDKLYKTLNEAIAGAATSSAPEQ